MAVNFPKLGMRVAVWFFALSGALRPSLAFAIGRQHFEPSRELAAESLASPSVSENGAGELTADRVKRDVGVELARRGLQLVDFGVRLGFKREPEGEWFAHVDNPRTGCELSTAAGRFDVLSVERAQSIALALEPLISRCASLRPSVDEARRMRVSAWVRPTAGIHAAVSLIVLLGLSGSSPPNASLTFADAPSAALVTGLGLATFGSGATLLVPRNVGERTLPLSFFASSTLVSLGFALAPEPGVPRYSGFALTSGYALTSAFLGVDWALHPLHPPDGDGSSSPSRAAWICFMPAVVGSLASMAPALAPTLESDDRELVLGMGGLALIPAAVGIALSVSARPAAPPMVVGAGPQGAAGLTLSGGF